MLPFEPESMDAARARYAAAVAEVVDPMNMRETPGQQRKHVFDFEDGLRLIISVDLIDYPRLHVSASAMEGSPLYRIIKRGHLLPTDFCMQAKAMFREISGYTGFLGFAGFSSGKGVPHWFAGTLTSKLYRTVRDKYSAG